MSQGEVYGYGSQNPNPTNKKDSENSAASVTQNVIPVNTPKEVIVIHDKVIIRAPTYEPVDVTKLRNAIIVATSRYYPIRRELYNLYTQCLLDAHLQGIIKKRFDTILNKPLFFKKNGKVDDTFKILIKSNKFRNLLTEILSTILWGVTGFDFIAGKTFDFQVLRRKHIKPKWKIYATEESGIEGFYYPDLKNVWVIGDDEDLGLLQYASFHVFYKRNAKGDWANFIQKYGQPLRIFRTDNLADEQSKIELRQSLQQMNGATDCIIPNSINAEVIPQTGSNSNGDLQKNFEIHCNNELDILILGNSETTSNSSGGSQAKAKIHKDGQDEIHKSDMHYLTSILNEPHFLEILSSYGYNTDNGSFEFDQETNIEYLSQKIIIDAAIPKNVPISDDYWYETYNIPKPDNYDQMKTEVNVEEEEQEPEPNPDNKPIKKTLKKLMSFFQ